MRSANPSRSASMLLAVLIATLASVAVAPAAAPVGASTTPAAEVAASDAPPQIPQPLTKEAARELMAGLSDDQIRQLLMQQLDQLATEQAAEAAGDTPKTTVATRFGELARTTRDAARAAFLAFPALVDLPRAIGARYAELPGSPSPLALFMLIALALGLGYVAERLLLRRAARARARRAAENAPSLAAVNESPSPLTDVLAGYLVFAVVAITVFLLVMSNAGAVEELMIYVVVGVTVYRGIAILSQRAFSPHDATLRRVSLGDAAAAHSHRVVLVLAATIVVVNTVGNWLQSLGLDEALLDAVWLVILTLYVSVWIWAVLRVRRYVAGLIIRGWLDEPPSRLQEFLARRWHVLMFVYLGVLVFVATANILSVQAVEHGPKGTFSLMVVIGLPVLGGYLTRRMRDWFAERAATAQEVDAAAPYGAAELAASNAPEFGSASSGPEAGGGVLEPPTGTHAAATPTPVAGRLELALRQSLKVVLVLGGAWALSRIWNVDLEGLAVSLLGERIVDALTEVGVTLLIAWLGWKVARAAIDEQLGPPQEDVGPSEGEGSKGTSRLQTVLPLLRRFLTITLGVMVTLVVLSALGVNIGPLLAGAGIVGLAVGFGAQTLVRDMVSGAFYLMEDAFRKGEYIDIGSVKGTVESISVRSLRLRHHLGPIHTIPYGEISRLTNYSRDWVVIRLEFRVPYDTDVQKVKKIFKQISAEMQEHPELGKNLLQPFKSQGVIAMEDSYMVMRAKFMAIPGEQFLLRREFYTRIQKAFAENGVQFAHRQVTVRVDTGEQSGDAQSAAVRAAGGGAAALAEAEAGTAPRTPDR